MQLVHIFAVPEDIFLTSRSVDTADKDCEAMEGSGGGEGWTVGEWWIMISASEYMITIALCRMLGTVQAVQWPRCKT